MRKATVPIEFLASRLFNTPLAIEESFLNSIEARLGRTDASVTIDLSDSALLPVRQDPRFASRPTFSNGVSVIEIAGPLVHKESGGLFAILFGSERSYEAIAEELRFAKADPQTHAILLSVDSPGGEVNGLYELAQEIREASKSKRVVAHVSSMACSAAYLLASAAPEVFIAEGAYTGSIGVVWSHLDVSRAEEAAGMKVTHFFAGKRKVDGTPHAPLTEEATKAIQERIDAHYDLFTGAVARYRGLKQADVKATEAGLFVGLGGVNTGLADGVKTGREVLAAMQADEPIGKTRNGQEASVDLAALKAELEALKSTNAQLAAEKLSLSAKLEELTAEVAKLSEELTKIEGERKAEVIKKHQMAGRVTPAMLPMVEIVRDAKSVAELDAFLTALPVLTHPKADGAKPEVEKPAQGTPLEQLTAKATELRAANPKLSAVDAFDAACKALPSIYLEHTKNRVAPSRRR